MTVATPSGVTIRPSRRDEAARIADLLGRAFPDEDLRPLVTALLGRPDVVSLVADMNDGADEAIAGFALFTVCGVDGDASVALLGPLAVASAYRRTGMGRALVAHGLNGLGESGVARLCVLGDPAYYKRLGFRPETGIEPPYPLPAVWRDAWQSRSTGDGGPIPNGKLVVPEPWRRPELWSD